MVAIVRTNFNGTVQETHEFTNDQIDRPEILALLRAVITSPDFLKPQRTTAQVTEALAETIAEIAKSLQKREAVELADAKTRAEMTFAQRKNLRIARFLNRIVFCFFAEDTGLLPKKLFSELLKTGSDEEILRLFEHVDNNPDHQYILTTIRQEGNLSPRDKRSLAEEALLEFYRKMRPGDPPTMDNARSYLIEQLFDRRRYDLERVGRYKLNQRLGLRQQHDDPDGR